MTATGQCQVCGAPLSPDASGDRCSRCLLAIGLEDETLPKTPGLQRGSVDKRLGDFELLEEISRGGMGVVYKARQISLNRIVAVKMLLAGSFAVPEFVQRFRTEAEAAASLHHPNIVPIHEFGHADGQYYLVMDYVEGENLAQLIRKNPLPPRAAAEYLETITEAVKYAHQQGILHRDLKPTNILVDLNNEVRITDFGLAKRLASESDITITGQTIGSPAYAAPEQVSGRRQEVGPHSDVYSLGAMLYEMLAGRPPFMGESLTAVVQQVQEREVVSPRLLNPAVPKDLESICLKCLEKEWRRRYATAAALAEDLGRFLRGEATEARPIRVWGRAQRWCKRKPLIAALTATSAAIFLLGFAGVVWQWRQAKANEERARTEAAIAKAVNEFLQKDLLTQANPYDSGYEEVSLRTLVDRAAEKVGTRFQGRPLVEAEVRATLLDVYMCLGEHRQARVQLDRALEIYQELVPPDDPRVLKVRQWEGVLLSGEGRDREGEAVLEQLVPVCRRVLGPTNELTLWTMQQLALAYADHGELEQAQELQEEVLETNRRVHGPTNVITVASMGRLAIIYLYQGELDKARELCETTLALLLSAVGSKRPGTLQAMETLASIYLMQGRTEEAEAIYKEVLKVYREAAGPEHRYTLRITSRLTQAYLAQGKVEHAAALWREAAKEWKDPENLNAAAWYLATYPDPRGRDGQSALEFAEKAVVATGRTNTMILDTLAAAYAEAGQFTNAVNVQQEAIALLKTEEEKLDFESRLRLYQSAHAFREYAQVIDPLRAQGKVAEVESLQREQLAMFRIMYDGSHAEVARVLSSLAATLVEEEKFTDAEPLARECLEIRERQMPDDWQTSETRSLLGAILLGQERYDEAEPLLLAGYEGTKDLKAETGSLKEALEHLATLYEKTGRPEQAAEWKQKLAELR